MTNMTNTFKNAAMSGLTAGLVTIGGAEAEPIEAGHALRVNNTAAFLAGMDQLFQSDDMADHKVSV